MPANTPVFTIHTLAKCREIPQADRTTQLGRRVSKLLELNAHQLPVPRSNVLSISFLENLFTENKLEVKFRWLLEHLNWQEQQQVTDTSLELQTLIKQIHWPVAAQAEILKHHQSWMTTEFLAVRPSFIHDQARGRFSILDIQGEANLIESILQLWANLYQPELLSQRWREWQQGIHIPAAILIQKMIQSTVSGFAQIFFSPTIQQPQANIYAGWGVTTKAQHQKKVMDEYVVNLKTSEVVSQYINLKQHEYIHRLDQLDKKNVPYTKQAIACLMKPEIQTLTEIFKNIYLVIGKNRDEILEVEWAYDGKNFFLLHIAAKLAQQVIQKKLITTPLVANPTNPNPSLPKLYLFNTTANPASPTQNDSITGLCFASDSWWLNQQAHPKALFEDGQAHYLKHRLLQSLHTYFQHHLHRQIWYRPQTLNSLQLRQLEQGNEYEDSEINPWLGYRGGLKMLHEAASFDFELDILSDFSQETETEIQLLLPWVRSSEELQLLYKHITLAPVEQVHHLKIWLECSTPENLLNIHHYADVPIQGIVVNLDELSQLLFGLDPTNQTVLNYYSTDFLLLHSMLKAVANRLKTFHKPMILQSRQSSHQIMSLLEAVGDYGLMIPATEFATAWQLLQTG